MSTQYDLIKSSILSKYGDSKSIAISLSKSNQSDAVALRDALFSATSWCPEDYSIATRLYIINNNVVSVPNCSCGAKCIPNKLNNKLGFTEFCSQGCSHKYARTPKELLDYDWMYDHRITKKMSKDSIGELLGVSGTAVSDAITKLKIPAVRYNESDFKTKQIIENKELIESEYASGDTWRTISERLGVDKTTLWSYATKHGIISRDSNSYPREFNRVSKQENSVADFIASIYSGEIKRNVIGYVRGNQHIDILIPDKNFAIEYNGVFHHQFNPEGKTDSQIKCKDYHLNKTLDCANRGVQLIHIFSDMWKHKTEICKSIIATKLGVCSTRIYARNCTIKSVGHDDKRVFLSENHLMGNDRSSINYGLYHNGVLVALMTFGTPRFSKSHDWELIRFCVKLNTSVVGGFSKLLKKFKSGKIGSIVSYADYSMSNGGVYEKNGFSLVGRNRPTGWGVNLSNETRINRTSLTKKSIVSGLGIETEMSESELRNLLGIPTIFDCGTLTYVLK